MTKLRALIQSRFGGNQAAFAAAIKRSPAQVNQWLSGHRAIGDAGARIIELALDLPPGYFDMADTTSRFTRKGLSNVEPGPPIHGCVPLISWVQAGTWCGIVDNFAPGDAEEWLPCPRKFGPHTFALRVRGLSMEPRYQAGDIIFVDPDARADHGKHVVVRLDDEQEATFKQLVVEGGQRFLRALNPDWPGPKLIPIDGNATICGVVIGKWVPE
ncbi:S24 family peptidase [Candidatus Accumulibacter vicinus]|nr:S24 family peptidase [Candidatus Accumulibacter vicinus]